MDFKQIQELIKIINKSNIGELSIEQNDFKVTIKQKEEHITQVLSSAPVQHGPVYMEAQQSLPSNQLPVTVPAEKAMAELPPAAATITIKSPMIGTFYLKSAPDKPNLVEIGSEVNDGTVVCIIEAMKLFNEIESEVKGKIVKILVENASPVEYDQPLFLVEPA